MVGYCIVYVRDRPQASLVASGEAVCFHSCISRPSPGYSQSMQTRHVTSLVASGEAVMMPSLLAPVKACVAALCVVRLCESCVIPVCCPMHAIAAHGMQP